MASSILEQIKGQIEKENSDNKCRNFIEILGKPEIADIVGKKREIIEKIVLAKYSTCEDRILDLSFEQSANLMATVSELLSFDKTKVGKAKRLIKQSINKSAKIRKELEQSSIATVQEYMHLRADRFEKKSRLLDQRILLEQLLQQQKDAVASANSFLSKAQTVLEEEIKRESISNISARAIFMLDTLQKELYQRQISKVEVVFRRSINMLMRKERFIDDIRIDDSFNIFVFRNKEFDGKTFKDIVATNTEEQFVSMFGNIALSCINKKYGTSIFETHFLEIDDDDKITLPVEVDKSSFSNGEKQIFIMALYYSLVQLGNHEIPFVIDTPFARIDTEHRYNIAKHFFSELNGQVFILSTNEEITGDHVQLLQDKILAKYLLENIDNRKTVIVKDAYFEV